MVTISKPLNAGSAQHYHEKDYSNREQAYYSEDQHITGQWQGKLAEKMGLTGAVSSDQFQQLSEGFDPRSGDSLVQHKINRQGSDSKTAEHRAGWDATFSAPKSVSLTAIVGGDTQVGVAHREAVSAALHEMERYANAHLGGTRGSEHTGAWAVAKFEHDSARPVNGYAAPQLHTHAFFFNVTQTADGKTRALDPQAVYAAQTVGTSVYQTELTYRLARAGYQFAAGSRGAPEIQGYSAEYLAFQSARSQQIKEHMEKHGGEGKEAANIAAKSTRENKVALSPEQQRAMNAQVSAQFGHQERAVMAAAQLSLRDLAFRTPAEDAAAAQRAVTFAIRKAFERESQITEGMLMREALNRAVGQVRFADLRQDIDRRTASREIVPIESNRPGHVPRYTSAELMHLERTMLRRMRHGQEQHTPIVPVQDLALYSRHYQNLNQNQQTAIETTFTARDPITAIQGGAGTGKTTSLAAIRAIAEERGYTVQGFAPTSRAAHQLAEAGIENSTLQKHLARGQQPADAQSKRLYILDESSLASTRQVHDFLSRLGREDRVILVGDVRQHQAVDAGTPFQLLQAGGIQTAVLNQIVRQTNAELKATVEDLSRQKADAGFARLEASGAVHEIRNAEERKQQLARNYVSRTESVLVIAPDNQSRYALNALIHQELQKAGRVSPREHALTVRIARQDLTGADREWAAKYRAGDEVRYEKGSKQLNLESGTYATVLRVDAAKNRITVQRGDGTEQTYDPQRLKGVSVYRHEQRAVSTGDRVQFTAVQKDLTVTPGHSGQKQRQGIANREIGTITSINLERAQMHIRLETGGTVSVSTNEKLHLDLGYAVTSHSSQSATANTVLFYGDNANTNPALLNDRLFYVAVSRARESAEIYTDNAAELKQALARDVSKASALSDREIQWGKQERSGPDGTAHDRTINHRTANDRANPEQTSSHDLLQAIMRSFAERLTQSTALHVENPVSETIRSAELPPQPDKREEHREGIQPESERTPINQQSPLNSYPKIETDLAYPDLEISF